MKAGGGSAKGHEFERVVARILTKWITGNTHPEIFWRSASSGAKSTQDAKRGRETDMHCDLVSVKPEGEWLTKTFLIECKSYKVLGWQGLWSGTGGIAEWWEKVESQAASVQKFPMLIMKQNRSPIYVVMRENPNLGFLFQDCDVPATFFSYGVYEQRRILFRLSDFCERVIADKFRGAV